MCRLSRFRIHTNRGEGQDDWALREKKRIKKAIKKSEQPSKKDVDRQKEMNALSGAQMKLIAV